MNSNGIIRKVDELGRIVIPVEIRKVLNIKEGEKIEFITRDNNIILSKKSITNNIIDYLNQIDYSIRSVIDGDYMFTDREKIIISSDKELKNKYLSEDIVELISSNTIFDTLENNKLLTNKKLYIFRYSVDNSNDGFIIIYNIDNIDKYIKLIKYICNHISFTFNIS